MGDGGIVRSRRHAGPGRRRAGRDVATITDMAGRVRAWTAIAARERRYGHREREVEPTSRSPSAELEADPDRPWITIVWNDPINLMSYVTHVFMTVFGYPKPRPRS